MSDLTSLQDQRIIAIDYFRGICMLMILCSHAAAFSWPYLYFSGIGSPWAGAAEAFFLLSGITFGIVRGRTITSDFKGVLRKSVRRSAVLYVIHILAVLVSVALAAFLVAHHLFNDVPGPLPKVHGLALLGHVADLSYVVGWADFLMYYAVYVLLAPFALYALRTRFWPAVPIVSILLLVLAAPYPVHLISTGSYMWFFVWQAYFFVGLTIARFRLPIIGWFYGLRPRTIGLASASLVSGAAAVWGVSALVKLKLLPSTDLNLWFVNNRTGILRLAAALLFSAAAYVLYQKYKRPVLQYSGRFVNALGRDTLWIFVAQSMAIPLLAAVPMVRQGGLVMNTVMTAVLIGFMWLITQRKTAWKMIKATA